MCPPLLSVLVHVILEVLDKDQVPLKILLIEDLAKEGVIC